MQFLTLRGSFKMLRLKPDLRSTIFIELTKIILVRLRSREPRGPLRQDDLHPVRPGRDSVHSRLPLSSRQDASPTGAGRRDM